MRAVCEVCSRPQPVDWKPGDLCVHCGQAVQRETRCFWCAKWTPAGKFCRRCGAAVVDDAQYGAARMLRDAGSDRFTIPRMLVELDPEQIDNFTRIYQRHAAVMRRHVDHVRYLENFLQQRHWSAALEEELAPQLPWPDERLEKLAAAMDPDVGAGPRRRVDDAPIAKAIYSATPFPVTRSLAILVRLTLDDWTAQNESGALLSSPDPTIQAEAALVLTGWRVVYGPGLPDSRRPLFDALRKSPFPLQAAVRLAMLGDKDAQLPPEAFASADPDVRFMAALAASRSEILIAELASEDALQRYAAASTLIALDIFAPLGETIRTAGPADQVRILRQMADRGKPAPDLRETVYEVAATNKEYDGRRAAVRMLCNGCPPAEVERLAETAGGDSNAYQSILQRAGLTPDALERLGAWFLRHGVFRAEQYGMKDIAKQGRMPANFVPLHWDAADEKGRIEFCRFAEYQLEEYADEDLLLFLVGAAFGPGSVPVRAALWTTVYRWHRRQDVSDSGPFRIETESLTRFFGSVAEFANILTKFLRDPSTQELLSQGSLYERVGRLLRYADDEVFEILAMNSEAGLPLAAALVSVAENTAFDFLLRIECVSFLGRLGSAPELREKMTAAIVAFQGTDLDYASKTALARLNAG